MRVFCLPKELYELCRYGAVELSARERDRLRALTLWQETGDVELVVKTFGFSRATLYRWRKRFDPHDLTSLKDRSRRPRRLRRARWSLELVAGVRRLRERYPRWGKEKLVVLLSREGFKASASTVGRILAYLKGRGLLREPIRRAISSRRRSPVRPFATRKPKDYQAQAPGDLVEIDTLDVRPLPGVVLKQFTARDVVSRWDVIEVHRRASAQSAARFLDALQARMPFALKALQVDGGSEFYAQFEEECQRRAIQLFVLPPKSPKLNGAVERAHRTHTEEFYEVTECAWTVGELNRELLLWEQTYNTIRPHQALGYLTPLQFLRQHGIIPKNYPSQVSHMY